MRHDGVSSSACTSSSPDRVASDPSRNVQFAGPAVAGASSGNGSSLTSRPPNTAYVCTSRGMKEESRGATRTPRRPADDQGAVQVYDRELVRAQPSDESVVQSSL